MFILQLYFTAQEIQEENSHELPINQRSIHEELQSSTQVNSEHKQVTENIAGTLYNEK